MFTYAQVEAILARLHGSEQWQVTAFRGRLKHFQRLGIPLKMKPGKGKRVLYTREHLYQWIICLEFSQFGFDPTWTFAIVNTLWNSSVDDFRGFYAEFQQAEKTDGPDWYLCLSAGMMTHAFEQTKDGQRGNYLPHDFEVGDGQKVNELLDSMQGVSRRLCVLNLSETLRLVRAAEADVLNRASEV